MNRNTLLIIVAILVLVAGGFGVYQWWTSTPEFAARMIVKAGSTRDLTTFRQYVDTKGLAESLVDDFMASAMDEQEAPTSGPEAWGQAIGEGLVAMMKPRIAELFEAQIESLVEDGGFDGLTFRGGETTKEGPSLDTLSGKIEARQDTYLDIAYKDRTGKTCVWGLRFRNPTLNQEFVLELMFRDVGKHWQLARFSNIPKVLEAIEIAKKQRLEELNAPIIREIAATLELISARKRTQSDRWGISKQILIDLRYRNNSTQGTTLFVAKVSARGPDGAPLHETRIAEYDPLAPGQEGRGTWKFEVGMLDEQLERLYELPNEHIDLDVTFTSITFDDGTSMEIKNSIE